MDNMTGGEQITRWPFPPSSKLNQTFSLWQLGSSLVVPAVGIISKIMTGKQLLKCAFKVYFIFKFL